MRILSTTRRRKKKEKQNPRWKGHIRYFLIGRWVMVTIAFVSSAVLLQQFERNFTFQISSELDIALPQNQQRRRKRHKNTTAYDELGHNNNPTNNIKTPQEVTNHKDTTSQPQSQPSKAKQTIHYTLTNHGLGVDLSIAAMYFIEAKQKGNDFKIQVSKDGWHYARGVCPKQDLSCFFEDFNIEEGKTEEILKLANNKGTRNLNDKDLEQAYSIIINSMTIPLPEIRYEIDKQLQKNHKPTITSPCGVIHVRHSDTVLNFGWGNSSETPLMKYLSLGEHLAEFKKIGTASTTSIKDIVLLTDDQNVIEDCKKNYQDDDVRWHYLEKKRFRGSEGGWENHFPSGNRRQEMIDILTEREMVANCSVWVGTRSKYGYIFQRYMKHLDSVHILQNSVPPKPKINKS